MKYNLKTILLLIAYCFSAQLIHAQLFEDRKGFTRADTLRGSLRDERTCFDVNYYHLHIKVEPDEKYIAGYCEIRFKTITKTKRIQIDLFENLHIDKIVFNDKELKYKREFNAVFIDFNEELKAGNYYSIYFHYSGKPMIAKNAPWDGGFSYSNEADSSAWVAVSCQGTGASCWWPTKDYQGDEPDSMLISITCPSELMDVSNGRLRATTDLKNGFTQYDWFVSNPINNYDVTLNIGKYAHFNDTLGALTLDYYVVPQNLEKAKIQFQQVKPMLQCFEKDFGKYPFYEDGYKLVETPYLGMEHQSAVAYGNKYMNGYLGQSLSNSGVGKKFDYIIIHESAHEWWGNSVTTCDIADMWVHEGFGMYAEALYCECMWGHGEYMKYINGMKFSISNVKPIIGPYGVNEEGSEDMYNKGALMLHTIRSILNNDEQFFGILKSIQSDLYHKTVTTQQIEAYFVKAGGSDMQKVLDQYLRYTLPPKIAFQSANGIVQYKWKADVAGFNMPIKINNADGTTTLLHPTMEWQTLQGYTSVENVKVATDLFYVKVSKD